MDIHYTYNGKVPQPDLQVLGDEIRATLSSNALYDGAVWSQGCNTTHKPPCTEDCQQPCNGLLVVLFMDELSESDKALLDTVVSHY
jgi:hypothetical protein